MGEVSIKRRARRLYHPAEERLDWQFEYYIQMMERSSAQENFMNRLLPAYDSLMLWVAGGADGQLEEFREELKRREGSYIEEWAESASRLVTFLPEYTQGCDASEILRAFALLRMFSENLIYEVCEHGLRFNRPSTWRDDLKKKPQQRAEPFVKPLQGEGVTMAQTLNADIERFCRDTLRTTRDGVVPSWLHDLIVDDLWVATVDSDIADSDLCVPRFIFAAYTPLANFPFAPDGLATTGLYPETTVRRDEMLGLEWDIAEDWDDFRKSAHARLEAILVEMRTEAEELYLHMNPSTEDRYRCDAKDLAALSVDGWQPIGEAHKKRLKRFAAFIGIDYPRQKLTSIAA